MVFFWKDLFIRRPNRAYVRFNGGPPCFSNKEAIDAYNKFYWDFIKRVLSPRGSLGLSKEDALDVRYMRYSLAGVVATGLGIYFLFNEAERRRMKNHTIGRINTSKFWW